MYRVRSKIHLAGWGVVFSHGCPLYGIMQQDHSHIHKPEDYKWCCTASSNLLEHFVDLRMDKVGVKYSATVQQLQPLQTQTVSQHLAVLASAE